MLWYSVCEIEVGDLSLCSPKLCMHNPLWFAMWHISGEGWGALAEVHCSARKFEQCPPTLFAALASTDILSCSWTPQHWLKSMKRKRECFLVHVRAELSHIWKLNCYDTLFFPSKVACRVRKAEEYRIFGLQVTCPRVKDSVAMLGFYTWNCMVMVVMLKNCIISILHTWSLHTFCYST